MPERGLLSAGCPDPRPKSKDALKGASRTGPGCPGIGPPDRLMEDAAEDVADERGWMKLEPAVGIDSLLPAPVCPL